jgi:hypothetical protein
MRFSLVVALVAVVGFIASPLTSTLVAAQNNIDGKWALSFDTPQGAIDASATFKADGETLTGTMESQAGSTSFKGTIKGKLVNFTMNVNTPNGDVSVQLNAELNGDELKGTFDFGGGVGNWTGKKAK